MRLILVTLCCMLSGLAAGQNVRLRDIWPLAPNAVAPLLSVNDRLDMVDFADNSMEARVRNALGGFSVLDTLTDNYLRCRLSENLLLELRLLPTRVDTVQVVAAVATSFTPEAVSTLELYTTDWETVEEAVCKIARPDACADPLAVAEYDDLPLTRMQLSADNLTLTLTPSASPLSRDARKALEGKLKPIILNWNHETLCFDAPAGAPGAAGLQ